MRCRGAAWSFSEAYPLFTYSGDARELLTAYKKGMRRSLACPIADILSRTIASRWPGRTIVPVPPRPGKVRDRGWDQVEELARLLEGMGHLVARPLVRRRSAQQKTLGRDGRAANAGSSYRLRNGATSPAHPLLLDDVITTGATVDACARALLGGGASEVLVLAIACD